MPHKKVWMFQSYNAEEMISPEAMSRRQEEFKREQENSDQKMQATIAALAARGVEIHISQPFGETLLTITIDGIEVGEIW